MSEARRRKQPARIPPQFTRVYCPLCGEVQWGYGQNRKLYGATVQSHFVWVLADGRHRERYVSTEPLKVAYCAGGEIDLVKDRAP